MNEKAIFLICVLFLLTSCTIQEELSTGAIEEEIITNTAITKPYLEQREIIDMIDEVVDYNNLTKDGKPTIHNVTSYVTKPLWIYETEDYFIEVEDNVRCEWRSGEDLRDCSFGVEIIYKNDLDLPYREFVKDVTFEKGLDSEFSDLKIKFEGKEIVSDAKVLQTFIDADEKVLPGNKSFRVEFKYPANKGEKINVTILGNVIDPEVDACSVLSSNNTVYTLNASISNSGTSSCFDVTGNNVTIDCAGYTIDGNDAADYAVDFNAVDFGKLLGPCTITDWDTAAIYANGADNIVVDGITTSSNPDDGLKMIATSEFWVINNSEIGAGTGINDDCIEMGNSVAVTLRNLTLVGGRNGVFDNQGLGPKVYENINITSATQKAMFFAANTFFSASKCNYTIWENVTYVSDSSGGKPVVLYNTAGKIEDWNDNFSQIILCNAENFVIENITVEPSFDKGGIFLTGASINVNITDSTFININSVHIVNSNFLRLERNLFKDILGIAVFFDNSESATVFNNTWNNSDNRALDLSGADESNVSFNYFYDQSNYNVYVRSTSEEVIVYNNYFSRNAAGSAIYNDDSTSFFNISKQTGTRVFSNGTEIGGNWYDLTSLTDSLNCTDANTDGFCDNAIVGGGSAAIDYFPLSDKWLAPTNSCTYGIGDWEIDCPDNCNLSDATDLGGNDIIFNGSGIVTITALINNFGTARASGGCTVTASGGGHLG